MLLCSGRRGFLGQGTFSAKTKKVLLKLGYVGHLALQAAKKSICSIYEKKKSKTDGQEAKSRCPSFNKNKSKKKTKKQNTQKTPMISYPVSKSEPTCRLRIY